jgi:hypothetical protein
VRYSQQEVFHFKQISAPLSFAETGSISTRRRWNKKRESCCIKVNEEPEVGADKKKFK